MPTAVNRRTVDLSQYPNLAVIYLGMRVNRVTGLKTLLGFGPQISNSVAAQPDGLLLHENMFWSLFPVHIGMRQYWRDIESLLSWSRSEPHRQWWKNFLRDSGGTGFWHETYLMQGGMEAIYDDVPSRSGSCALLHSMLLVVRCSAPLTALLNRTRLNLSSARKNSTVDLKKDESC